MVTKNLKGRIIPCSTPGALTEKGLLDIFIPQTTISQKWKHWKAIIDLRTCFACLGRHGKVYNMDERIDHEPPLHLFCRCEIEAMMAIAHGNATWDGEKGADYTLFTQGVLPDYYISRDALIDLGWKSSKAPAKYAPGKMLFGGIYYNTDGRLPSAPGRIWFEADINYYSGKRNKHRIFFSNDGLMFVTYDHAATFYEII